MASNNVTGPNPDVIKKSRIRGGERWEWAGPLGTIQMNAYGQGEQRWAELTLDRTSDPAWPWSLEYVMPAEDTEKVLVNELYALRYFSGVHDRRLTEEALWHDRCEVKGFAGYVDFKEFTHEIYVSFHDQSGALLGTYLLGTRQFITLPAIGFTREVLGMILKSALLGEDQRLRPETVQAIKDHRGWPKLEELLNSVP